MELRTGMSLMIRLSQQSRSSWHHPMGWSYIDGKEAVIMGIAHENIGTVNECEIFTVRLMKPIEITGNEKEAEKFATNFPDPPMLILYRRDIQPIDSETKEVLDLAPAPKPPEPEAEPEPVMETYKERLDSLDKPTEGDKDVSEPQESGTDESEDESDGDANRDESTDPPQPD